MSLSIHAIPLFFEPFSASACTLLALAAFCLDARSCCAMASAFCGSNSYWVGGHGAAAYCGCEGKLRLGCRRIGSAWPADGFHMARPLQRQIGHNSSRVTKGKRMFVEFGDPRSAWARRWNDLVLTHAADVGGFDMLSEAQISLCRRAATMEIELEAMEARMSEGQKIDLGTSRRTAEAKFSWRACGREAC
jgi:hypothetical protein